jgi:hypothetical protein
VCKCRLGSAGDQERAEISRPPLRNGWRRGQFSAKQVSFAPDDFVPSLLLSKARIFPDRLGYDTRIYECPQCDDEFTENPEYKKVG